jgi:DNA-binding response OmpR family regulator
VRILVIEDSPPTRDLLLRSLESAGHEVITAARVSTGRKLATAGGFDVLVIDIMLPDGSGLDLCREIRNDGIDTPILFLTARGEVSDRVSGLDAGGDDYLRKPFAIAELLARLRALGRRRGLAPPSRIETEGVIIDFAARRLRRGSTEVTLTPREWAVLEVLASRAGRVVAREDLLEAVWGDTSRGASESLEVIVSRIRQKFGREEEGTWIRTARGQGYIFEPPR